MQNDSCQGLTSSFHMRPKKRVSGGKQAMHPMEASPSVGVCEHPKAHDCLGFEKEENAFSGPFSFFGGGSTTFSPKRPNQVQNTKSKNPAVQNTKSRNPAWNMLEPPTSVLSLWRPTKTNPQGAGSALAFGGWSPLGFPKPSKNGLPEFI